MHKVLKCGNHKTKFGVQDKHYEEFVQQLTLDKSRQNSILWKVLQIQNVEDQ